MYHHPGYKVNFYVGFYQPENYLNPANQHNLNIRFNPLIGDRLQKDMSFTVDFKDNLEVVKSLFAWDKSKKAVMMNKLLVFTNIPQNIKIKSRLLDPAKWDLKYDDGKELPAVSNIESPAANYFIITFSKDVEPEKKIGINFSPADGINSKRGEITSPKDVTERSGDVVRKAAYACEGCEGTITPENIHEAEICEDWHTWTLICECPESCYAMMVEIGTLTSYSYANNYMVDDSETGTPFYTSYDGTTGTSCYGYIFCHIPYFNDWRANYFMIGFDPPSDCGKISNEASVTVMSDIEPPVIDEYETAFSEVIKCNPINCLLGCNSPTCGDCEKWKDYVLTVSAHDNKCINSSNIYFYIHYSNGTYIPIPFNPIPFHNDYYGEQSFKRSFTVDPNIFACADFLKIIVHDRKGNWSSLYRWPTPPDTINFDPIHLPYPWKVEISYDERLPQTPGGGGYRQYVNLDSQLEQEMDQELCAYRLIQDSPYTLNQRDVNHGEYVFLKVEVKPNIFGIPVLIEYGDPLFNPPSKDPTNKRAYPQNPQDSNYCVDILPDGKCSPSNNCDQTAIGNHILWSRHTPYKPDDIKVLGDNWNYYYDYPSDLTTYNVPPCDPIWRQGLPDSPCFLKCYVPYPLYCTNNYCSPGMIANKTTNYHGKVAVYFDTKKHGGDNFYFKARLRSTFIPIDTDCGESTETPEITVWRKIFINYAWMESKPANYIPGCPNIKQSEEWKGHHRADVSNFSEIKGIFDDCFIEMVPMTHYLDTYYSPYVDDLVYYGDSTGFRPFPDPPLGPPHDTIALIGIDHFGSTQNPGCGGDFGQSYVYWVYYPHDAFYPFTAVGWIHDWYNMGNQETIDLHSGIVQSSLLVATAHEITHIIAQTEDTTHNTTIYGIMSYYDARSYLHEEHIMLLRDCLPAFDLNEY